MTKEESKKARKVMEAWENGAEIEVRNGQIDFWFPVSGNLSWLWDNNDYRIAKPKPVELKVGMELVRKEGVTLVIRKIIAINNGNCFYSVNCHSYISTIAEMIDMYVYLDDDGVRHELISPEPF